MEIKSTEKINLKTAIFGKTYHDMKVRLPKDEDAHIANTEDVFRIMQKILMRQNRLHRKKEYFWTLGLNNANDIEYIELVCIGSSNKVIIDPVDVFNFAVAKKCKQIILVHNHPGGTLKPSKADIELTSMLKKGAQYLHIVVLDHLIITENDYMSFANEELL